MGVKHFFIWFKKQFKNHIKSIQNNVSEISVDNLLIDMNGIFHNSAQKIYEYGNHKPTTKHYINKSNKQILMFQDVTLTIETLISITKPKKRIIMCIDGTAPISKQFQQRKRRFKTILDNKKNGSKNEFDSNCISPGTQFMDYLSKYIDWYIKKRITEDDVWKNLEIIFSDHSTVGEGEHSLLNYIRRYGNPLETFMIHGLDADLIMLSMCTHLPYIYILRDELYDKSYSHCIIDVGSIRHELIHILKWINNKQVFNYKLAIYDFVLFNFLSGNDFLPQVPGIEILEGSIDLLIDIYKLVGQSFGHLTKYDNDDIVLNIDALQNFFYHISSFEKIMLENKMNKKHSFFPDLLLDKHSYFFDNKYNINIDSYRKEYMSRFDSTEYACHSYIQGMQWVLTYYTKGVPSWDWFYPFHYAPISFELQKHISTYKRVKYELSFPNTPFEQLLSILPPESSKLLPYPLSDLLTSNSDLKKFCPKEFDIDLSGKRKEWEGIILLPMVDNKIIKQIFKNEIQNIDAKHLRRNMVGHTYKYTFNPKFIPKTINSYYGNLNNTQISKQIFDI